MHDDAVNPQMQKIQELEQTIADLQVELDQVKVESDQLKDLAGRSQADLQNAKDRMQKEAADIRIFAAEGVLLKLLPTIDNFERAFQHLPEDLKSHEWIKGVQAIEQDLLKEAGAMGLKKMDCLGQPVDPSRHEVLLTGEGESGTVIEVIENGYELHGKVIRPAKVKVGA